MLVLTALTGFLAGCSTPSVRQPVAVQPSEPVRVATPDEVRKLREEARENFAKLKEEHGGAPGRRIARADTNLPSVEEPPRRLQYVSEVAWQPPVDRSARDEDAAERTRELEERRWQSQQRINNYRVFEEGYARQLGKKSSQLTREERAWVRDNFE